MESESAVRLERRKTLLQLERTVEQLQYCCPSDDAYWKFRFTALFLRPVSVTS